jgi:hypothetical protein
MRSVRTEQVAEQQRVVDDAIRAYVDWREECETVRVAYHRWANGLAEDAAGARCGYHAALDRDEAAAEVYARCVRSIGSAAA